MEDIYATGGAEYYNQWLSIWQPAWGEFGVYRNDEWYITTWETYGDETVYYTGPITEIVQLWGWGTIYDGAEYTTTCYTYPMGEGDTVNVGAAGRVITTTIWGSSAGPAHRVSIPALLQNCILKTFFPLSAGAIPPDARRESPR